METTGTAAEFDRLAAARLADLREIAADDDETLVRLCAEEIRKSAGYIGQVEDIRDQAVARLRAGGIPLTRIARYAGVSDSLLSRRLGLLGLRNSARHVR